MWDRAEGTPNPTILPDMFLLVLPEQILRRKPYEIGFG